MSRQNQPSPGRTLVLCFDGSDQQFNSENSNVVRLFAALDQSQPDKQLTYYQPGIGTYVSPNLGLSKPIAAVAKFVDLAVAWYLDAHIIEGYRFLMNNYKRGDKIYMFGFSRGAYTARCLAGMLDKVGLLVKGNEEQVQAAYQQYKGTTDDDRIEAQGFKETFGQFVEVDFLGCWDTVSSVGIVVARELPFSSSTNAIVKKFRHALSLDEHRVRFLPNLWHLPTPDQDRAQLMEESSFRADVKEVWFCGGHTNVGGGKISNDIASRLANIPLQWMISEILASNCQILFKPDAFKNIPSFEVIRAPPLPPRASGAPQSESRILRVQDQSGGRDASQAPYDALDGKLGPLWWLMEVLPMKQTWQDVEGRWHTTWLPHFAAPRVIQQPNPIFHSSVSLRQLLVSGYKPRAKYTGTPTYVD